MLILSDANLDIYGVSARQLSQALSLNEDVNAFIIFIGSLGSQADALAKALPGEGWSDFDVMGFRVYIVIAVSHSLALSQTHTLHTITHNYIHTSQARHLFAWMLQSYLRLSSKFSQRPSWLDREKN